MAEDLVEMKADIAELNADVADIKRDMNPISPPSCRSETKISPTNSTTFTKLELRAATARRVRLCL